MEMSDQYHDPAILWQGERDPGRHYRGSWVCPSQSGHFGNARVQMPDHSLVTILTTPSWLPGFK